MSFFRPKAPKKSLVTSADLERMGVKSEDLPGKELLQLVEGKPIEWPIDSPTRPKEPLADRIRNGLFSLVLHSIYGLLVICLLLESIILIGQSYLYLKGGTWPHWVLFTAVEESLPASFRQWLLDPQDWFGLQKVVFTIFMEIPIAFSVPLLTVVLIAILLLPIVVLQ